MTLIDLFGFFSIVALAFVVGAIFGMSAARRCLVNRKWATRRLGPDVGD